MSPSAVVAPRLAASARCQAEQRNRCRLGVRARAQPTAAGPQPWTVGLDHCQQSALFVLGRQLQPSHSTLPDLALRLRRHSRLYGAGWERAVAVVPCDGPSGTEEQYRNRKPEVALSPARCLGDGLRVGRVVRMGKVRQVDRVRVNETGSKSARRRSNAKQASVVRIRF